MTEPLRAFAVATPGLETALAAELASFGVRGELTKGGVELTVDATTLCMLNRRSRIASRLLVRLGQIEAENFPQLKRRAATLPWSSYLTTTSELDFAIETHRCRLFHTGGIEEQLRAALATTKLPKGGAALPQRLVVRGTNNRFTVSIDASGELLHRRGQRSHVGEAPLRETLAAGILRLAGYDGSQALIDPMCGSGGFLLEAAGIASGAWPNADRAFACDAWPSFTGVAIAAAPTPQPPRAPIIGRDQDAAVIAAARHNCDAAGLAAAVRLEVASLATLHPPAPTGLLVCNPPYGKRLGSVDEARALAKQLGRLLRERFHNWRAAILLPPAIAKSLGLRSEAVHALSNGGLRVDLLLWGHSPLGN